MWQLVDQHRMAQVAWSTCQHRTWHAQLGPQGALEHVGLLVSIADPRWYGGIYLVVVQHLGWSGKFGINWGGLQVL